MRKHFNFFFFILGIFLGLASAFSTRAWGEAPAGDPDSLLAPEVNIGPPTIEPEQARSTVDRRQIDESFARSSEDALRAVPGIAVSRAGGLGQTSFIFIRGADSGGTLVRLDGIPLNDASSNNKSFDFSLLNLDDVARIEVWKGPQSVLFGSGATGGVIDITTKRGRGPLRSEVGAEYGAQDTLSAHASVRGSQQAISYSAVASRFQTSGISAASETQGFNEADSATVNTGSVRLGWQPRSGSDYELLARWSEKHTDLDYAPISSPPFVLADTPNYRSQSQALTIALRARQEWNARWNSNFLVARQGVDRSFANDTFGKSFDWLRQHYTAETFHFENFNQWRLLPRTNLVFGLTGDNESAATDASGNTGNSSFPRKATSLIGVMTRGQWNEHQFFITAGARVDQHSKFGNQTSWEVQPGLHLSPASDLFLRTAAAYKAPTLYELYDPQYGNSRLRAERVIGEELAWIQYLNEHRLRLQTSLFRNQFSDLVQWNPKGYSNIGSARTEGVEIEGDCDLRWMRFQLGYAYLESHDDRTGESLPRRPRNSLSGRLEVRPSARWTAVIDYSGFDHRVDVDPVSGQNVIDASVQTWNAAVIWQPAEAWRLHARLVNILDLHYDEVAGYGAYGRTFYGGAAYTF